MSSDDELQKRVDLALAQAKRIRTEAHKSVVQLARMRDILQPEEPAQGGIAEDEYRRNQQES